MSARNPMHFHESERQVQCWIPEGAAQFVVHQTAISTYYALLFGKSLEIHSETDSSLNPQTLMSVHKIRIIAIVMRCVETLLEVIPASAMLDSREMEGTAPVGCVTNGH